MANIAKLLTEHMDIWTAADTEKKSGRGRASGNSSSVYGVKKLRELILGLAISGKLLPQDPIDTSTQEVTKKLGLNRKVLNEALLTEFELPSTWQWFCVSDLCDLKTGATPSTSVPAYYGGHIRWLVSGDIHGNEIYDCEGRITELGLSNSNCKILPENSILIALNGQGKTRATVAMLRCEATCNQSLVAMISKYNELILPEFILLNLKYRYTEIRDITGQIQRRGLNMGLVGDLSVSVPPLSEQHRIVAKVDELMALCEHLEQQHSNAQEAHETLVCQLLVTLTQSQSAAEFHANWQRIYAHFDVLFTTEASIDALKQTLLQLAVMGKLVSQDPNDEPASVLLKRIQAEKAKLIAEGKLKKEKLLAPISEDEKPFELPKGWEWLKFGELTALINGDRSKNYPNQSEYVESGIAWINTGHIRPDGTLSSTEMNFITKEKFDELRSGKIKEGDLVYCLRGATFGKTAFVKPYSIGAVASSLVIIRPYNLKLGEYIYKYLISPFGKSQVYRFDNGSAQPNLSANSVTLYAFPLPPLAEQHRIVAKVDELMAMCDQLKTRIHQAYQQQQTIADALVAQALT